MSASSSPASDLRPLAIGELVDRAAVRWRQDFGVLFRLYLVFQLGVFILMKGYELAMARWFPLLRGGPELMAAIQQGSTELMRQYALGLGSGVVVSFATVWLSWTVAVAGSHYVIRRQLGEPATMRQGLERAKKKFGTLNGAFVLSTLWGLAVGVLSCVPGGIVLGLGVFAAATGGGSGSAALIAAVVFGMILILLGILAAMVWYVLRFLLTAQVIAMEDVGAFAALRRSGQLISGRVGEGLLNLVKIRATLLLTIVFAIVTVVGLLTGAPALIVQAVFGGSPLDPANATPDAVPQALLIPAQLFQVVAQAAFAPLYLVFGALFYVDMRVRREGLDLELKLSTEQQPRAAA